MHILGMQIDANSGVAPTKASIGSGAQRDYSVRSPDWLVLNSASESVKQRGSKYEGVVNKLRLGPVRAY